uniref:Uncharacterized protein n=1 Tax=Vespula pensylvanica TaxID=30213 RepID=A0A834UEB6_VESPE|nr:hypothetical protein H0235_002598 [Vespula pensylvanica]
MRKSVKRDSIGDVIIHRHDDDDDDDDDDDTGGNGNIRDNTEHTHTYPYREKDFLVTVTNGGGSSIAEEGCELARRTHRGARNLMNAGVREPSGLTAKSYRYSSSSESTPSVLVCFDERVRARESYTCGDIWRVHKVGNIQPLVAMLPVYQARGSADIVVYGEFLCGGTSITELVSAHAKTENRTRCARAVAFQ